MDGEIEQLGVIQTALHLLKQSSSAKLVSVTLHEEACAHMTQRRDVTLHSHHKVFRKHSGQIPAYFIHSATEEGCKLAPPTNFPYSRHLPLHQLLSMFQ